MLLVDVCRVFRRPRETFFQKQMDHMLAREELVYFNCFSGSISSCVAKARDPFQTQREIGTTLLKFDYMLCPGRNMFVVSFANRRKGEIAKETAQETAEAQLLRSLRWETSSTSTKYIKMRSPLQSPETNTVPALPPLAGDYRKERAKVNHRHELCTNTD